MSASSRGSEEGVPLQTSRTASPQSPSPIIMSHFVRLGSASIARLHAIRMADSRILGSTAKALARCLPHTSSFGSYEPLISSSGDTGVCFSISTSGLFLFADCVEVLASTLGQAGAFVSAPSKSINSSTDVLLSFAAIVRLHSVTENPGPFREVSNGPV